jgi:hypothetical protein
MEYKGRRKLIIIFSVTLTILLAAVVSVVIASGCFLNSKYLEPWNKNYSENYKDVRVKIISNGILAASGHNMQPWKVKLDDDKNIFYLYADSHLLNLEVDPLARQTMITQGTFLEYLIVAGNKFGYDVNIELFPKGEYDEKNLVNSMDSKPVAKINLSQTKESEHLYNYMFYPDTNREAYEKTKLTEEQISTLKLLSEDDIDIRILDGEEDLKKLGSLTMKGAEIEAGIHRMNMESANVFRSNEYTKNKFRYGYSFEGQDISGLKMYLLEGAITLIPSINSEKASKDMYISSTKNSIENTPCYGIVATKGNSRIEQVKSGMVYSRLVLTAHSLGLAMQPLSQVLEEYPEMKDQYSEVHKEFAFPGETLQMLFRIGKPTKEIPKSMRRDVMDIIAK